MMFTAKKESFNKIDIYFAEIQQFMLLIIKLK